MVADQRHVVYRLEPNPAQVNTLSEKKTSISNLIPETTHRKPVAVSFAYVRSDLRKTALVTSAIVIAQIILFMTLNRI